MSTSRVGYHHGNLRAALVAASVESLEAGEELSVRAVARRAGVSPTAPYRHFADRQALESAVAAEGFADLRERLRLATVALPDDADAVDELTALGLAYVTFALERPALFRVMFGNECDPDSSDRVQASRRLHAVVDEVVRRRLPGGDPAALSIALWSLAHGLAFLHLDGKLRPERADEVADRVRAAVGAILAVSVSSPGRPS